MRMLEMDFLGAPTVGDLIQRNLDHFDSGLIDPCNSAVVEPDMSINCSWHTSINTFYPTGAILQGSFNARNAFSRLDLRFVFFSYFFQIGICLHVISLRSIRWACKSPVAPSPVVPQNSAV